MNEENLSSKKSGKSRYIISFILLFSLPLIGLSQNIYASDEVKFNKDSTLILLKSNENPVSGIIKKTCTLKRFILNTKTDCEFVVKNGLFMSSKGYYKNKQISQETQRNGMCIYYYKNGEIEYMGNQKNGLEDGVWKYLNKKGDLKREDVFEEGLLKTKKYYKENGLLDFEREWTSDSIYILKLYYEGVLLEEGTMKNEKKDGIWKYYISFEDGTTELEKEIIFKNGKKLKK